MKRRASGFTLIELMLVVAIAGVLSSIALPSFRVMQLRSRRAERPMIVRAVETALDDLWVRQDRFPGGTPVASTFTGPWNPPLPAGSAKRPWNAASGDWGALTVVIEGDLYYSYRVDASVGSGVRTRVVLADGDLDADGRDNIYSRTTVDRGAGDAAVREVTETDNGLYADLF